MVETTYEQKMELLEEINKECGVFQNKSDLPISREECELANKGGYSEHIYRVVEYDSTIDDMS